MTRVAVSAFTAAAMLLAGAARAQEAQPEAVPAAPAAEAPPAKAAPRVARRPQGPAAQPKPAAPDKPTAVVGALDKRTGRSEFFTMTPGQRVAFGPLTIALATCETTAPWERPRQSGAFVQVFETPLTANATQTRTTRRVFSGWLFAESPSLNPFRHPVYDVWLSSCAMRFPDGPPPPAASPPPSPQKRSSAAKSPKPATALPSSAA